MVCKPTAASGCGFAEHHLEAAMNQSAQPSKERVKQWLAQRQADHKPLPDMKQIRRELGWGLAEPAPAAL